MASAQSRPSYTEAEMADAFMELLESPGGLPGLEPFTCVHREARSSHGRPDFMALRTLGDHCAPLASESLGSVGPYILAILKPKAPRTLRYLVQHSEFTEESVRRWLRRLIAGGYVEQTGSGSYRLGASATQFRRELWVFELKLSNTRRAVFQAQQSRAYANRSIIVVPPGQEKNYARFSDTLKRWGIGLATFNVATKRFCLIRSGRSAPAFSHQHKIYTLSQLMASP